MSEIYLDNAATTLLEARVASAMAEVGEKRLGNPASLHRAGVRAAVEVERARGLIAAKIGAEPEEVYFTSGGTESNSLAVLGACRSLQHAGKHLLVSAVEHPSVLENARWLAELGFELSVIPVDSSGRVRLDRFEAAIRPDTVFASVMHVNNEVGTVQEIAAIGELCRRKKILFHVDACQSFLKIPLDLRALPVQLLSLSAHKAHGPRGMGALVVRKGVEIHPWVRGGGQENGLRSGTLNTEGILGFGAAVAAAEEGDATRMALLSQQLVAGIERELPGAVLNGSRDQRACHIVNFQFPSCTAKELLFRLDRRGIFVSTGSACASGKNKASSVLLAMGKTEAEARSSVRFSLSRHTTSAEIAETVRALKEVLPDGR